MMVALKAV